MECRTDNTSYHYDDSGLDPESQEVAERWLSEVEKKADSLSADACVEQLIEIIESDSCDAQATAAYAVLGLDDKSIAALRRRAALETAAKLHLDVRSSYDGDLHVLEIYAGREAR